MNLELGEDQKLVRDSFAKFFRAQSTPARARAVEPLGFDAKLWADLVAMGAPTMRVPAAQGGSGMGLLDAAIVAEEAGRHMASAPLAESIVAARLLAEIGGAEAMAWLNRIKNGDALVTLALHEARSGEAQLVPGGAVADAVLALDGGAIVLYAEPPPMKTQPNLGSSPIRRMMFSDAPDARQVLATGVTVRNAYLAAIEEWKLLNASMLTGLARQALELAAAYSRERIQFGRPIGSYQAIAHPLAESLTEIDGASLLIWRAIWAVARGRKDAGASVSMASWWAGQAAGRAASRSLRTFGGYGLSLEYDIQCYFRRAKTWALMNGDPREELLRVADRLWGEIRVPLPDAGSTDLEFGYGEAADKFAAEARDFFERNLTPELRAKAHHSTDGHDPSFHRKLADAGLLFPDWPVEYGGQGRSRYELSALVRVFERFNWTRIPIGNTNMCARMAMLFGSDELKREALPKFAKGEALSCLGFSEPSCGSDVLAAQTRAVRDGDDWIVNGQKMFTTAAHMSDYVLLLTRTNPDVKKHEGLTLFLAPLSLPGIEIHAVHTLTDERTNITYYADVRVPDRYRLGAVDRGVDVMAAALSIEHGGEGYHVSQQSFLRAAVAWAQNVGGQGNRATIENADVRARVARAATHTEIADLLCRRAVWAAVEGVGSRAFGPMSKLFSTETYLRDSADLLELAAPDSLFQGSDRAGLLEMAHRHAVGTTIYGGTSEIHRSIIAEQGLGLPRTRG